MPFETMQIKVTGYAELEKRFANARPLILASENRMLRSMGDTLVPVVKSESPVGATHHLRNYTTYRIIKGTDYYMQIRQSAKSDNGYIYGAAVRLGTKAHFPPVKALIPWVIAKLGIEEKMARNVAFLVARKISKVGTAPNPYHERAVESVSTELSSIAQNEMDDLCERLVGKKND